MRTGWIFISAGIKKGHRNYEWWLKKTVNKAALAYHLKYQSCGSLSSIQETHVAVKIFAFLNAQIGWYKITTAFCAVLTSFAQFSFYIHAHSLNWTVKSLPTNCWIGRIASSCAHSSISSLWHGNRMNSYKLIYLRASKLWGYMEWGTKSEKASWGVMSEVYPSLA